MTEIFNLKVGDLFIYKGTVYEIITTCIVILVIIQKWKYEKI